MENYKLLSEFNGTVLAEIKGCVEFTLDNDESLTFESEKKLNELIDKLEDTVLQRNMH